MQIFEMKGQFPKKAGDAKLVWCRYRRTYYEFLPNNSPAVERSGSSITLALLGERADFLSLRGGEEFIVEWQSNWAENPDNPGTEIYYAGSSGGVVFVKRLNRETVRKLITDGEEAFYAALKPKVITALEAIFGLQTKRLGHLYAFPLPASFEVMHDALIQFEACTAEIGSSDEVLWHIDAHTRRYAFRGKAFIFKADSSELLIVKGSVEVGEGLKLDFNVPHVCAVSLQD